MNGEELCYLSTRPSTHSPRHQVRVVQRLEITDIRPCTRHRMRHSGQQKHQLTALHQDLTRKKIISDQTKFFPKRSLE